MSDISMERTEPPQPDPGNGPDAPSDTAASGSTPHLLSDGALFPPVTPDPPPPPGYVDPIPGLPEADVPVPQDPEDFL
jgi:hypothetical protein